jgi:hypothetical protein
LEGNGRHFNSTAEQRPTAQLKVGTGGAQMWCGVTIGLPQGHVIRDNAAQKAQPKAGELNVQPLCLQTLKKWGLNEIRQPDLVHVNQEADREQYRQPNADPEPPEVNPA